MRKELHQRAPQGGVERVHRAVPFRDRVCDLAPHAHFDRRFHDRLQTVAPHGNVIGHDGERRLPVLQQFADQKGERTFRGFEFVALMLQFFDAGENRLQLRRVVGDFETEFLRLEHDVALAGEVADENGA